MDKQRWLRPVLGLLLLAVLLAGAVKGAQIGTSLYSLLRHGMRLKALMGNPAAVLEPREPEAIRADLGAIEEALGRLRSDLGLVLRPRWLPWSRARQNLHVLDELFVVAADLAHAGQEAADGLESVSVALAEHGSANDSEPTSSMSEALYAGLVGARPHVVAAELVVVQAADDVAGLAGMSLWSPLSDLVALLHGYLQVGAQALDAVAAMPRLLGEDGARNYLLLAQNSDELRATGGWITGIGLVSLGKGTIERLQIQDSYAVDTFKVEHPWPPEPFTRYMGIDQWATRDGNWSPDFVVAARDVERLYHIENPEEVGGVVAFDMFAMRILLGAVGSLYLGEYQDHVTSENVMRKARDYWNPTLPEGKTWEQWTEELGWKGIKDDWWKGRKDFMNVMAQAFLSKLQSDLQPDRLNALLRAVYRAIAEKHLLLYFHEPSVQGALEAVGMDGGLRHDPASDFLLVLDSNMGYNKVNFNVRRSLEYKVSLNQDGAAVGELAVTYSNRSPAQPACVLRPLMEPTYDLIAQDCYFNYLRVYVPQGSRLISTEGLDEAETLDSEDGCVVFAAFFVVPAAESKTVRFTYQLPKLARGRYALHAQKQAGTDADSLRVQIVVPENMDLKSVDPRAMLQPDGTLLYETTLRQDRSVRLTFR